MGDALREAVGREVVNPRLPLGLLAQEEKSHLPAALAKSQCCPHPPPPALGTPRPGGRAGKGGPALCPPLGPGSGSCPNTPSQADSHSVWPQLQDPARSMWAHGASAPRGGEGDRTGRGRRNPACSEAPVGPGQWLQTQDPRGARHPPRALGWPRRRTCPLRGPRAHGYLEVAGCGWGGLAGLQGGDQLRGQEGTEPEGGGSGGGGHRTPRRGPWGPTGVSAAGPRGRGEAGRGLGVGGGPGLCSTMRKQGGGATKCRAAWGPRAEGSPSGLSGAPLSFLGMPTQASPNVCLAPPQVEPAVPLRWSC